MLSYNIHKGLSTGNRAFVLKRIREAIRLVHADLVFLQEVVGDHQGHRKKFTEWPDEPQFEFLAEDVWPHYTYGKNAVYTAGHHGNAILSKYPIRFSENIDVSANPFEQRGILHAVIETKHGPIHALCVHLGLLESDRRSQLGRLCNRIDSHVPHDEAVVIAGDFNDWRKRASGIIGKKLGVREAFEVLQGAHAKTFPAWLPAFRLDRVYYRGMEALQARCLTGKPWNELSDHAALSIEMKLTS